MPTYGQTQKGYGNLWDKCVIKPDKVDGAGKIAKGIIADTPTHYAAVEASTGVPSFMLGALHMRESSRNFLGVLHNGEHILGTGRKTRLVPAGRGPFNTWDAAAIDAIKLKGLQNVKRWSVERILYECERFNGFGYTSKGVNSPYVWSWTNQQQPGKYVADGVFSRTANDVQPGCAAMIKAVAAADPAVARRLLDREAKPPKDVVDQETKRGKQTAAGGAAGGVGAGGVKTATEQPTKTIMHSVIEWTVIGACVGAVLIGVYMVIQKKKLLTEKWG